MLPKVVLYFIRPYRNLFAGILVVILCASVLESLSLAAFFPVFATLLGDAENPPGGILGAITSMAMLLPFDSPIVAAAVFLTALFFLKTAFTLLREVLVAYASGKVIYQTKNQLMEKYSNASYQFFLDRQQGALIYNSQVAPHRVGLLMLRAPQITAELFKISAIVAVLIFVSPLATLVVALVGGFYLWGTHYLSRKVSYNLGRRRANASTAQTVIANEFLSGIRNIIVYCTKGGWLERFRRENRTFCELYARDLIWLAAPRSLMEFTAVLMMVGLLLVLYLSSPGSLAEILPGMGVFAIALVQLLPSVTNFGRMRMEMMGTLADAELVYHSLTGPVPERRQEGRVLESFNDAIAFENVSFAHQGRDPLLCNVGMGFEKGQVTAIVGPSGAGKTTIVNLILGLFEPTGGQITIDGIPLTEYKPETWLGKIGLVSQESFICHATVADNITFGRTGHSRESVIKAAQTANAHGFICELPQKYDTLVGEMGMKLSGGQQQRVAIARAVLDEPEVLIFDEATSSLDSISEKLVQEAIDNVSRERTVIIIAHRLSTIRHADKIIVLEQGRVVEEGGHQELLRRRGPYSKLVASST